MSGLFDKTGRAIEIGDVLKVYHFTGARRKRHFMFKQVLRERTFKDGLVAYAIGHLSLNDDHYYQVKDGRHLADYEIVQSVDAKFEDRLRMKPTPLRNPVGEGQHG